MGQLHSPEIVAELEMNGKAYEEVRPQMELEHWGKIVLLSNGAVVSIYNDEEDAYKIGCEKFGLGHFSLHVVGARSQDLGFHSLF